MKEEYDDVPVTPPNLSAETSEGGDFMYVSQHIYK